MIKSTLAYFRGSLRSYIDGYSHAYWGWGQEDDDLGARLKHAGIKHDRPFEYPGPMSDSANEVQVVDSEAAEGTSLTMSTQPCTGRVQQCDHDPGERDCGVYPYSRLKEMFHPTPAGVLEGLALPPSRSLVEGTCFIHAHEGGFSRLGTSPSSSYITTEQTFF